MVPIRNGDFSSFYRHYSYFLLLFVVLNGRMLKRIPFTFSEKLVCLNNVFFRQSSRKVDRRLFVHYRILEAINVDNSSDVFQFVFVVLAWVNATQAFMLMAFIFGSILLILMLVYRKEFRHNVKGYQFDRVAQPRFTFIIAGLILFFCCKKFLFNFSSNNPFI